jgi:hypothetical protein
MAQAEDKNLPSLDDYLMNEEGLPSVEDYIEVEEEEKQEQIEETVEPEVVESTVDLTEILHLINDVRKDIPEIPEVKYYDDQLETICEIIDQLREKISVVPEVKYYDDELEAVCEQIDQVRNFISNKLEELPEVKYYDEQVQNIEDRIDSVIQEVSNLPEPKYYEDDLLSIKEDIEKVRESIPTFPKWVNEINEVPDFTWIGKTFSVIDEDFIKVNDTINTLAEKINIDFKFFEEDIEKKYFEQKTDLKNENNKISEEFLDQKEKIWKQLSKFSLKVWEIQKESKDDDRKLKKQIKGEYDQLKTQIESKLDEYNVDNIKTDELLLSYFNELKEEVTKLPEVKYYDDDIRYIKEDIISLRSLVQSIKNEQKDLNEELQQLNEVALEEPHDKPQNVGFVQDPLTPVDQKFATFKDLKEHYQIFINRIQTQLSSIGGGGAGFIKDLDDVSFDQTTGNNKLLIYNSETSKWVGIASTALGGGGGNAGVGTDTNINTSGIITAAAVNTNFITGIAATFSGNVSVGGTLVYQDVKHIDAIGIITAQQGIQILNNGLNITSGIATIVGTSGTTTIGGIGNTALFVDGNARVVGLLTVGRASVTIDGDNNTINVGLVTITNSSVTIGDNVTINTGATGINSAPNVFYVAKDGNDDNNGTSIDNAKLTIKGAVSVASSGSVIKVMSGNYVEDNPIELPAFSAVVGDDLRTCKILPNNTTSDIFHVNKGCKLQNMTFSGHLAPAAAVAFPTNGATNVGGGKWKGPYVQNCTSDTTTGTGIRVDGSKAVNTKSMNVDAFTQYNQGGVGVAVTNEGYAQLVSVFTICCNVAIQCHAGGQADVANSNCSFGTNGLVADGKGNLQFIGTCTASADAAQDNVTINVGTTTTRPYDGQIAFFGELFKSVESITVGSGGTGYTSTPTVTVADPTGVSGETATAFATLEGESVASITIISSGSQYQTTPTITISDPDVGSNGASATATMTPIYYTINSSTPIVSGITTLTLEENLLHSVGVGTSVHFFQQSKIIASSHTFEYIGAGNTITEATPKRGGVTIQANEVTKTNGGNVVYTSTDQSGNFRIGDDLQINQNTGTISGRAFSRSLFTEMTPFILALS